MSTAPVRLLAAPRTRRRRVPVMALLRTELRVQQRYRVPAVLIGFAVPWSALVYAAPVLTPYLLFIEVAAAGIFIAGALAISDRATGIDAALVVSPAPPAARVAVRLAPLLAWTVLAALPVLGVAQARTGTPWSGHLVALAALALCTLLMTGLGLAVAAARQTLMSFLTRVPWPLAPLVAVPLAVAAGLLAGPAWYLLPTTGTLELLRVAVGGGAAEYPPSILLAYLLAGTAAVVWYAVVATNRAAGVPTAVPAATPGAGAAPGAGGPAGTDTAAHWASFVAHDLRNIARDAVTLPIAASPLLLGLALRFAVPPLVDWAARVHELDLTPYLPVLALLAVVLHIPVIAGMLGALAALDDRDDGALAAVRTSPLGTGRYLAYRLGLVTAFAVLGLAAAAPLSGLVPASAWGACLLAVPLAPLFTLGVLAAAGNRVAGVAAVKVLGLPMYAPIAAWWLTGAAGAPFAVLPAFWVVRAWSGSGVAVLAGGVAGAALWAVLLWRPALRRLSR